MAQPAIQTAFHAGEWAPALNARVDVAKYHSGAALLENFFVDYRGGASTRPGTKYVIQCLDSLKPVRLIPFQASTNVGYIIEFGDFYARFINNGAPVLEVGFPVSGATQANPCVLTIVGNDYVIDDVIRVTGVAGMTQLNGRYFKVANVAGSAVTISDLNGVPINSTGYGAFTGNGTAERVYTISTPYAAEDLALLKFAQNVNFMVLCHPNYETRVLTLIDSDDWTLLSAVFGATIPPPNNVIVTTSLTADQTDYAYVVTAVDVNGQESGPSAYGVLANVKDLRTTAGTNSITWDPVSGAASYNVYKAISTDVGSVPVGSAFGYIGNTTGVVFNDNNIGPDFSITPPVPQNPFQGAGVQSVTVNAPGVYTVCPSATVAPSTVGPAATVQPVLGVLSGVRNGGSSSDWSIGDTCRIQGQEWGGVRLRVTSLGPGTQAATFAVDNQGSSIAGSPSNPVTFVAINASRTVKVDLTWGVTTVGVINPGVGYLTPPAITFSSGAAVATAVLSSASSGNPAVPAFFQQRLVLSAQAQTPQSFNMSQVGIPFNFDVRNPIQPTDAIINAAITSGQLNTIKSHIPMPNGLITLSDRAAWLINGGGGGEAITAVNAVANAQSYNGASDVPPIVANADILYVQAKGSIVRNLVYNFYTNVYTGTDISILSSHLFFGYQILEWAWAEEPYKVVWAIRNDGVMLSLTFMKEQELIGWTHSVTQGLFTSVAEVVEGVNGFGNVNAVYNVVERDLPGVGTVKYIERHAERFYPNGVIDAWCVDSGLQYRGAPATQFTGAEHLAGLEVTGLADGVVIPPFTMSADGSFTLTSPASVVTIGLAFVCDLQTLAIDLGEPTVQGKRKKITGVTVRAKDTLGIKIGSDPDNLTTMKDFQIGSMGTQTNKRVTGLVTGDGRTILDPKWQEAGQFYIRQDQPLPASILGVIPEVVVGDTPTERKER